MSFYAQRSVPGTRFLAILFLGLVCVLPVLSAEPLPGLTNVSVRVVVDERASMPETGTIGFGVSVFRVEPSPDLNLARVDGRLRQALRAGLEKKGFTYTEETPDYLVSYALASGADLDEAELNRAYGEVIEGLGTGTDASGSLYYRRGVLIVDFVDRKAKRLLWRGAILAEIDMTWPEVRKQERCDVAVLELLRFFPRFPR